MAYLAVLLLCYFVDTHAAVVSRTSSALQADEGMRWNPFKAVADAVRSKWTGVDKMRGDLCWDREDMLNHEKCMEWMVKKCKSEDANQKRCDKLKNYVKDHCMNNDDKEDQELACDYAKELGVNVDPTTTLPQMPAPSPAQPPAAAPGPAAVPAPAEEEEEKAAPAPAVEEVKEEEPAAAPAPAVAEEKEEAAPPAESADGTTGKPQKLQSQGFEGKKVRHVDGKTYASDWGDEYEHPTTTTTAAPARSGVRTQNSWVIIPALSFLLVSGC